MFFDVKDFDVEQIRQIIYDKFKSRPRSEINFNMSHDYSMACFVDDLFFITDDHFVPRLIYQPLSLINACTISFDNSLAICQTANNHENNDDSGAFALIDVNHQKLIGKSKLVTGWKYLTHLFLDSEKKIFYCYYDGIQVGYDFNFNPINESQVALYNKKFGYKKAQNKKDTRPKWEKELDARNKARAGINEDTIKCDWLKNKTVEERKKYFRSEERWKLFESGVIKDDNDLEKLYKTIDTTDGVRKVFKTLNELKEEGIIVSEKSDVTAKVKNAILKAMDHLKSIN